MSIRPRRRVRRGRKRDDIVSRAAMARASGLERSDGVECPQWDRKPSFGLAQLSFRSGSTAVMTGLGSRTRWPLFTHCSQDAWRRRARSFGPLPAPCGSCDRVSGVKGCTTKWPRNRDRRWPLSLPAANPRGALPHRRRLALLLIDAGAARSTPHARPMPSGRPAALRRPGRPTPEPVPVTHGDGGVTRHKASPRPRSPVSIASTRCGRLPPLASSCI
jgi:hypothetical protein